MSKYIYDIGLEVHVELATKTKIFCGCSTKFGGAPNTHICPVCMALPGTLPVLNKKVVELAIAVGLATNCSVEGECRFDRKNYFYPDNPQNYQISQLYKPICRDGYIEIYNTYEKCDINLKDIDIENIAAENINTCKQSNIEKSKVNNPKRIRIIEMHMEEDAGKLIHDDEKGVSFIDFNRAGVPLIEIVSAPDMNSADEVIAYLDELRSVIRYLDVSDCKLNEGSMRVDVNLSVRKKGEKLGTRTEMKNLNSFKAIRKAIDHEAKRQIGILQAGECVVQETRRWDDNKGCSYSMRSKENSNDYRYFPEPDLLPVIVDKTMIDNVKAKKVELRRDKMRRYAAEYCLSEYDIDILTSEKNIAFLFENVVSRGVNPKVAANWIMVDIFKQLNNKGINVENFEIDFNHLSMLINLVETRKITKAVGVEILEKLCDEDFDPEEYANAKGLLIVEDIAMLEKVIDEVFAANPKSIEDYNNGKTKAMGFLVGQTMKAMKGKAAPDKVNEIINKKLHS